MTQVRARDTTTAYDIVRAPGYVEEHQEYPYLSSARAAQPPSVPVMTPAL